MYTQRVTDWFDSRIGRTIQSVAASKWFGQMEARELYEIAPSLGISPEERDRIEKAGQGEGLLVTTGRRVWVNLYGHTSPGEFAMANTDVLGVDVDEGENSSEEERTCSRRLLRMPRGVEVGVAIPIGCMVPLAIAAAVLVGAGVLLGNCQLAAQRLRRPIA